MDIPITDPLSPRELEVMKLIEGFYTKTEIAEMLFISVHTVKAHVAHIRTKLGVNDIRHGVRRLREIGVL